MKAVVVFLTAFVHLLLQRCYGVGAMKTYCEAGGNDHSQSDVGVHFKSKPKTPAVVCTLLPISMYCCMSNFSRIQWFRYENNAWTNLKESHVYSRYFYERNQTVRFGRPSHVDAGEYKCVGYGRRAGDEISYVIEFIVRDCVPTDKPRPLYPLEFHTKRAIMPGSQLQLPCMGLVGRRATSCDEELCDIGWKRTVGRRTVHVSDNATDRVHFVNEWIIDGNGLQSTLYIDGVLAADFDGQYTCWMRNKHALLDPARKLGIRRHYLHVVKTSGMFKVVTAMCSCIIVLAAFVFVVVWQRRLHIRLYFKERRRTSPRNEDLEYDLVLMCADDSRRFSDYLYQKLAKSNTYNKLDVFRYDDDVVPGHRKAECLLHAVSKSRCVLAVISPLFIADQHCRFCFESTVRAAEVDIIHVLYGDITSADDDRLHSALRDDVRIALRNSRRRFVSPLSEDDLNNGIAVAETLRRRVVDRFWVGVRLAIPNRREQRVERRERQPLLA